MTTPNPQSPTPEDLAKFRVETHVFNGGASSLHLNQVKPEDGARAGKPTPSPTLQSAAEGAAHKLAAYHWTSGSKTVSDYIAILLSDFSFVEELVRERDEARAERDRTISGNAKLRASLETGAADLSTARSELESSRSQWRMSSVCRELNAELEQARQEASELIERVRGYESLNDRQARQLTAADEMAKELETDVAVFLGCVADDLKKFGGVESPKRVRKIAAALLAYQAARKQEPTK